MTTFLKESFSVVRNKAVLATGRKHARTRVRRAGNALPRQVKST